MLRRRDAGTAMEIPGPTREMAWDHRTCLLPQSVPFREQDSGRSHPQGSQSFLHLSVGKGYT